jgi:hypothetical protein
LFRFVCFEEEEDNEFIVVAQDSGTQNMSKMAGRAEVDRWK